MSSGEGVTVRSTCASSPCGLAMRSRAVAEASASARGNALRLVTASYTARRSSPGWIVLESRSRRPRSNVTQAWYTSLPGRVFG